VGIIDDASSRESGIGRNVFRNNRPGEAFEGINS
jgi:hypothetical protein